MLQGCDVNRDNEEFMKNEELLMCNLNMYLWCCLTLVEVEKITKWTRSAEF